jgi:hypothetical protein
MNQKEGHWMLKRTSLNNDFNLNDISFISTNRSFCTSVQICGCIRTCRQRREGGAFGSENNEHTAGVMSFCDCQQLYVLWL